MPSLSKWVGTIHAENSVAEAAQATLKLRLATVVHFLRLAADQVDKTPEHVHQLRVSTRRSLAALAMYEEVLPAKRATWFRKQLRRIRRAAGDARDLDVLLQRYEKDRGSYHKKFLRQVKKRRRKAQRPIVKLNSRLISSHRFETHVDRLLASIVSDTASGNRPLGQWARSRLASVSTRFFQSLPKHTNDLIELHRFRVRGKQLRYAMELFSTLFPPDFRTSLYPLVAQLQDRLGEVNDHATARQHLIKWSEKTGSRRRAEYLRGLTRRESELLEKSIEKFTQWWTPSFARRLEASFAALTNGRSISPPVDQSDMFQQ